MTEEEKRRAYMKAYYAAHKEEMKAYCESHKEEIKAYKKAYNEAHREDRLECYCSHIENIENYELAKADDFIGWDVHHRLETHNSDGERRTVDLSKAELIALGMYFNRPASELIYMKKGDHMRLHNNGKPKPEETRAKLREAAKHRAPMSEATKAKMSTSRRGKHPSDETRAKLRAANLGKHPSEETRAKISASVKLHLSKTSAN